MKSSQSVAAGVNRAELDIRLGASTGTVTFTPGTWRTTSFHYGCGVRTGTTAPVAATTSVG